MPNDKTLFSAFRIKSQTISLKNLAITNFFDKFGGRTRSQEELK